MRRASFLLNIHRITASRKLQFLGLKAEYSLRSGLLVGQKIAEFQFDDLETFEGTKCKPISITLAVEKSTRRILGIEISQMPANGRLARVSKEKYGHRKDQRKKGRNELLRKIQPFVVDDPIIQTDSNPHYKKDVHRHFPNARYFQYKGKKASETGLGELKRVPFDPLFSVNHTLAMLRANINRLFRKTWCTTKKRNNLYAHLLIYAEFHNEILI